jgi:hypothetical protein
MDDISEENDYFFEEDNEGGCLRHSDEIKLVFILQIIRDDMEVTFI